MAGAGAPVTPPTTPSRKLARPTTPGCCQDCPHALLQTSGGAVGLPKGQMGNSEVGHMNIGAGRVVAQDLPRIDVAIEDGSLARRPVLLELLDKAEDQQGRRASDGPDVARRRSFPSGPDRGAGQDLRGRLGAGVRACFSGWPRHAAQKRAGVYREIPGATFTASPGVRLATMSGRYYAMDRDKRWDRVTKCYARDGGRRCPPLRRRLCGAGQLPMARMSPMSSLCLAVLGDYAGMEDGDAMLFANFRADRAREISLALLDPGFEGFQTRAHGEIRSRGRTDGIFRRA